MEADLDWRQARVALTLSDYTAPLLKRAVRCLKRQHMLLQKVFSINGTFTDVHATH